ncbi:hypothetical protein N7493_005488 [Penicillium malachiteum]|uniref:Uncharacterized protein n=1 Tax=Penicillium malachiteum TaxID=1324776 RepID=A0AAD6HMR2_9EURO|nr:hypothetical protein N7493_005488 [Penicillium malachiteum]
MNIIDTENIKFTEEKGFCEDFDERKSRDGQRTLSREVRQYPLESIGFSSVFSQTESILRTLRQQITHQLEETETALNTENWIFRPVFANLDIDKDVAYLGNIKSEPV